MAGSERTRAGRIAAGAVVAAASAFVGIFGRMAVRLHDAYATSAFDLGIFDQGLWLLSRGREPFVTMRGLHLFGDHSSYVMVLLTPLYWLFDDVRALMVLTVVGLAAGAPLLYAIGRRLGVAPPLAGAVSVAYLLYPALEFMTWWSFHPELLAVPLLLAAFLFALQGRSWWFVATCVVVLAVKEDAALVVTPLGLWLAATSTGVSRRVALGVAALGVGAFALNVGVLLPHFSPTGELVYTNRYGRFGDSLAEALVGMVTDPVEVATVVGSGRSLAYLAKMLLPLALGFCRPSFLLVGAPVTMANLVSSQLGQADIRFHYSAYLTAVASIAAMLGAERLAAAWRDRPAALPLAVGAPATVLALALGANLAWSPSPIGAEDEVWIGPDRLDAARDGLLAAIPGDAVISADPFVVSHLGHRERAYMFPNPWVRDAWGAEGEPALPDPAAVEWVVVRPPAAPPDRPGGQVLDHLRTSGDFEVVLDSPDVVVLRRAGGAAPPGPGQIRP